MPQLSAEAMEMLERYGWPGNIRELKNVVERAAVLCDGPGILIDHLPVEKMRPPTEETRPHELPFGARPPSGRMGRLTDAQLQERQRIIDALTAHAGNQSRAAKALNMPRRTFVSKLDLYGIPRPQKDAS
jgi:DNA-binding NtrC family response regulator